MASTPVASSAAVGGGDFSSLDEHALPFITVDEEDKFHLNPEAVRYLKSLQQSRVAIVAIAGVYRSGKSYLLNQLMNRNGSSGQFVVGPTVKATTKGIWIWGRAMEVEGGNMTVLFMDTEGLGSTVRSESYDARIFALALLLSSYFVYNSVGTIDGSAIAKLSYVAQLTKHIKVRAASKGEDSGTEFNQHFPSFLWVVRDFAVKLESRDGRKISAREYLEEALRAEDGVSEAVEAKNAVRAMLRSFFPERDCVTLVRPMTNEKDLAALGTLPPESLRPEFRAQIEALRRRVFSSLRPKQLYGEALTGGALAALAEAYVNAINAGGTPTISTAWDRVVESQCSDAVEGGLSLYRGRMRELLLAANNSGSGSTSGSTAAEGLATPRSTASSAATGLTSGGGGAGAIGSHSSKIGSGAVLPPGVIVEDEDLHSAHAEASAAALGYFSHAAVQDRDKTPPYEAQLREGMEEEAGKIRRVNDAASAAACNKLLDTLHADAAATMAAVRRKQQQAAMSDGQHANSSAAEAQIARATAALTSAAAVARAYRTAASTLADAYSASARGPAKHRCLAEYAVSRLTSLLGDAAASADECAAALIAAYNARVSELAAAGAAARGREKAAADALAQERASFERTLAEQARSAGEAAERLKSSLTSKTEELERANARYDKLLASHEAAAVRADEAAAKAAEEIKAARRRVDELQTARATGLLETAVLATRLAEAEAARGDAERLAQELRLKVAEESKAAALLLERCRAAENETVRLREQTELLYESVRVQKDMLATQKVRRGARRTSIIRRNDFRGSNGCQ